MSSLCMHMHVSSSLLRMAVRHLDEGGLHRRSDSVMVLFVYEFKYRNTQQFLQHHLEWLRLGWKRHLWLATQYKME